VAVSANYTLPMIGKLLGHSQARTTQRYAHLHDDPVRQASERLGAVIGSAIGMCAANDGEMDIGKLRRRVE